MDKDSVEYIATCLVDNNKWMCRPGTEILFAVDDLRRRRGVAAGWLLDFYALPISMLCLFSHFSCQCDSVRDF